MLFLLLEKSFLEFIYNGGHYGNAMKIIEVWFAQVQNIPLAYLAFFLSTYWFRLVCYVAC